MTSRGIFDHGKLANEEAFYRGTDHRNPARGREALEQRFDRFAVRTITPQIFCRWRNQYGGMDVSDARRLRMVPGYPGGEDRDREIGHGITTRSVITKAASQACAGCNSALNSCEAPKYAVIGGNKYAVV